MEFSINSVPAQRRSTDGTERRRQGSASPHARVGIDPLTAIVAKSPEPIQTAVSCLAMSTAPHLPEASVPRYRRGAVARS